MKAPVLDSLCYKSNIKPSVQVLPCNFFKNFKKIFLTEHYGKYFHTNYPITTKLFAGKACIFI